MVGLLRHNFELRFVSQYVAFEFLVIDDHDHTLGAGDRTLPCRCDVLTINLRQLLNAAHRAAPLAFGSRRLRFKSNRSPATLRSRSPILLALSAASSASD